MAVLLVPLLTLTLLLGGYSIAPRVADKYLELETGAGQHAKFLADASRFAMLVADSSTLETLARGSLETSVEAVAAVFFEEGGGPIASAGQDSAVELLSHCRDKAPDCVGDQPRLIARTQVVSRSTMGQTGLPSVPNLPSRETETGIGEVMLAYDTTPVNTLIRSLIINGVFSAAAAALIAVVIGSVFSRRLLRPVQGVSRTVRALQSGDLHARVSPCGSGELRELEEGVNSMAEELALSQEMLQKRIEEATAELSKALSDLEKRNQELDEALERAEQASRAKDLFLARMSHELRTPLASVVGYADLMKDELSRSQRAHYGEMIDRGSALLQSTVDDILSFVKLQEGNVQLEQKVFDPADCLESTVLLQSPAAHARGLDLDCILEDELPSAVRGDPVRLAQIINNLLSNAIKFTLRGGVLLRAGAQLSQDGKVILNISVTDSGIGISPQQQSALFQPFAQADESVTRRFGGSGLGLSISRRLAQLMDGDVMLRSSEGDGTRVELSVSLELVSDAYPVEARDDLRHLSVLTVDASVACAEAITAYLQPLGIDVVRVTRGSKLDTRLLEKASLILLGSADSPRAELQQVPPNIPVVKLVNESASVTQLTGENRQRTIGLPVLRTAFQRAIVNLLTDTPYQDRATGVPSRAQIRCTVLVVEDNTLNRELITDQLSREGARALSAAESSEALAMLEDGLFDLVLMDVHMPGMNKIAA